MNTLHSWGNDLIGLLYDMNVNAFNILKRHSNNYVLFIGVEYPTI